MREKQLTSRNFATFPVFREILELIVNLDNLDLEEEDESMNEWYELYRTMKEPDVVEWAKFHFQEVNKNTHDFWLDKRGLAIYELRGKLAVSGIFPVF